MEKQQLADQIQEILGGAVTNITVLDQVTLEVSADNLIKVCTELRDHAVLKFEQLIDVCGVDYLDYGKSEWRTNETTESGYSRGRAADADSRTTVIEWNKPRYACVYHLLSVTHNHRVRIKVYLEPEPTIQSVIDIWPSANWFEREAFDLFGIIFEGHPDLRRILTDYGFKGHPFRKDFPLVGEVEMRYDAQQQRCVYEPVSIQPRTLVPKVIREDSRYLHIDGEEGNPNG